VEQAELAGTVVFAISGVLAVAERRLDLFGAMVVGVVTALGGGTVRGLVLGEIPVFWIEDQMFLAFAVAGAVVAIPVAMALERGPVRRLEEGVKLADAAGLALFTVVGADIAFDLGQDAAIALVAALITAVGGGVIRDLLAGRMPLVMRGEIYATAALAGAGVYLGLVELTGVPEGVSAAAGMVTTFGLRVAGMRRGWSLPVVGG
jgi:uncharacterized membrane protein YeiH